MKNCQKIKKQKNKKIFDKNLYKFLILIILIIGYLFFTQNIVFAAGGVADLNSFSTQGNASAIADAIKTSAPGTESAVDKGTKTTWWDDLKQLNYDKLIDRLAESTAIAYKAMLKNFLNTLAYDTATYLATGDKGQQPMFITEGWGEYLKNTADNAAGTFIETLGKKDGIAEFNLCTPDPKVLLKINLGLKKEVRPSAPECKFSKLVSNWDQALKDKDFLTKFQDMFNPWSNDLGIALTLQTGMTQSINIDVDNALNERLQTEGYKNLTDPITGKIKTPAVLIKEYGTDTLRKSSEDYFTYTGNAVADAIDVFVNTLLGKLVDQWMKKGIVTDFASKATSGLTDSNAQNEGGGISEAEDRFKKLVEASFKVRGDYDILNELTMCPDPSKAGPTDCVIDQKFREAIEKKLTVKQAIEQGYLNGNGIFGFTSDGLEPNYKEGYPYRSMTILRKFRILPVGWEVAAEKIKDQQQIVKGTKNLKYLVDCFEGGEDWCRGLIDPNWVLKAPQNYCAKEGAGPEVLSQEVYGEGSNSYLVVSRNESYCADEQSCVKEKSDGSCQVYGYCTEEKRTWDFNAKSCEPRENTCQTFKLGDQTISYLQNTLDYSVCNAGNAGCKKYAVSGLYDIDTQSVNWNEANNPLYFNKNAETCQEEDEGCHAFIRLDPGQDESYIDIREAGISTAYSRFSSTGTIYEKLLPNYLESVCYGIDGKLKSTAPEKCLDFVRKCRVEEAGCELYTNSLDGSEIPAKVYPNDYCPSECVGYDTYIQKETAFDLSREAYFIPRTARKCTAEAVGCSQFTNLDEVARGGEGIEYYSVLRQCLKKTGNEGSCAEFYSWEGSDESGYQLKVETLKANNSEPAVTSSDSALCNETIYNLLPSNPAYNPDCRQFYNREGFLSYHLYNYTISCSDDCHPYRKTISETEAAESCKGGTWNNADRSCIYMAIPGQGVRCTAAQNGCREYTGNTGNNVRNIFVDDFTGGTTANWVGVNGSTVEPSSESINLDANNKGSSLYVKGGQFSASRTVGTSVSRGKSYVLSFVAKAAANTVLNLSFVNSNNERANFAQVSLTIDWQIFQTNLADLDHEVSLDEILLLAAGNNFYIDNITLTEVVDRYYLIKDSWVTPASCDEDQAGAPHALYMLGCGRYTDRDNKTHYLKSFTELCSESAVGCEMMIDTKNSTDIDDDDFAYVVYDKDKLCNAQDKGCQLLGKAYEYEDITLYIDAYLKNDPDKYNTISCVADAVGCEAFTYDGGEKYFKDPGDQVCEWRKQSDSVNYSWYKKKVKRCGGDGGEICFKDADCAAGKTCKMETKDNDCQTSGIKTLGFGGIGNKVEQPTFDNYGYSWAGICSAANSGCTEYIDPVSKFNTNLIFNGDFQDLDGNGTYNDGWGGGLSQDIVLEANTVYRISGPLTLNCQSGGFYTINSNNNFTGLVAPASISTSAIFYNNNNIAVNCKASVPAADPSKPVALRKIIVDYQLKQNVNFTSCNGIVDFDDGCVLFNQRSYDGAYLAKLTFNADATTNGGTPEKSGTLNANTIIKVSPDRVCDKWLSCRSYIKDEKNNNVCFDVGLCDAVDANGNCSNFIQSVKSNQAISSSADANKISNLSGYAKVGIANGSLKSDYYPLGAMVQEGELINLANGSFEYYGSNFYPIGWNWSGLNTQWDANFFSIVNNPVSAQTESIGYAPDGNSFLKLGSSYSAISEETDVMPNTKYIITAYVNTKNLKSGTAKIDILDNSESVINNSGSETISQSLGMDWQFQVGTFTTDANDSRIKIKLYSASAGSVASQGNFYFDDIKIRPALNSRKISYTSSTEWYTTQSCRLYPKNDSLSCDYYEDSGIRQKGWYGYCLEYDRAPGNPNNCILWYPVDKVKGDGIEEGAGYTGRFPLYYTIAGVSVANNAKAHFSVKCSGVTKNLNSDFGLPFSSLIPLNYAVNQYNKNTIDNITIDALVLNVANNWQACTQKCFSTWTPEPYVDVDTKINGPSCKHGMWYCGKVTFDAKDVLTSVYVHGGDNSNANRCSDQIENDIIINTNSKFNLSYGSQLVQTVSSVGQNKYWSSRVYKGSDYVVPNFGYTYTTDLEPFGSASVPNPSNNPSEWPLLQFYMPEDSDVRAGSPHTLDTVKRLFAQSYGAWEWSSATNKYERLPSIEWSTPTASCPGNVRPAYPNDYCAILPYISHVKVNSVESGAVTLIKNGFVNLTFNSKADSNQLPLVGYTIDWGDGEKTAVTGVEMRDRPNPDSPHSMYHLYSYWDLKSKANRGLLSNGQCFDTYCRIKPRVQIRDNWGWYNNGSQVNTPGAWDNFSDWIIVNEK